MTKIYAASKTEFGHTSTHEYYYQDGAAHWVNNNAPVPMDVAADYEIKIDAERQQAAIDAHTAAFLAEYRKNRANMTDEQRAEEQFEARAAFGPNTDVVNIVTGEKFNTGK